MDYQDSRIGFISSAQTSTMARPPPPDAVVIPKVPGFVPAPYVAKIVQGLESELYQSMAYAAFLEKELVKKEYEAAGLAFYIQ